MIIRIGFLDTFNEFRQIQQIYNITNYRYNFRYHIQESKEHNAFLC